MPHSVSPESKSPPNPASEDAMADAPPAQDDESQNSEPDVPMAEADSEANAAAPPAPISDDKKDVKLEDLFADVGSDDEFPSSRPGEEKPSSPPVAPSPPVDNDGGFRADDPEIMRMFYQRLFPWRYLFQWLNHGPTPTNDMAHREFAMTLSGGRYVRYNSYPTVDLLRKDMLAKMPERFEIGPVYSTNPRDRKTLRNLSAFRPLSKELCFDIDMDDYNDVRTCCGGSSICARCWQFITMAVKVVDAALRDDFGFRHVLWVYSGRRGAHAWVCDRRARAMDDQRRRAIVGYLHIIKGGKDAGKKVNVKRPLHPHLSRSLDTLAPHFQRDILEAQDPWRTPERAEKLLSLLPDRPLAAALRAKWDASPGRSSTHKWADIDTLARSGGGGGGVASSSGEHNGGEAGNSSGNGKKLVADARALLEAKQDIVLEYTYPRLDAEVSKKLNHLLKSPFCVHPGTGRVCVPIDARRLDQFDPLAVPTAQGLLAEIDAWNEEEEGTGRGDEEEVEEADKKKNNKNKNLQDWEKTALRPYVEHFRTFVLALMRDERGDARAVKRERDDGEGTAGMEF
ncbi:prim-pol domain-containing protein [Xylariaceae sp. FL0804]|nr:prim-pol domain-containing protein [Xylariaceae sp. FL0804]